MLTRLAAELFISKALGLIYRTILYTLAKQKQTIGEWIFRICKVHSYAFISELFLLFYREFASCMLNLCLFWLQMESSAGVMHENMKSTIDYQTHHRLRESQGRAFAEDLNDRVQYWSLGQSVVILLVSIGQIIVLRSFFTDKRPHSSPSFVAT